MPLCRTLCVLPVCSSPQVRRRLVVGLTLPPHLLLCCVRPFLQTNRPPVALSTSGLSAPNLRVSRKSAGYSCPARRPVLMSLSSPLLVQAAAPLRPAPLTHHLEQVALPRSSNRPLAATFLHRSLSQSIRPSRRQAGPPISCLHSHSPRPLPPRCLHLRLGLLARRVHHH